MNIFKKISLIFFVIALTFLINSSLFAENVYEGPSGEIFIGDVLPEKLKEKGYRPKDAKKEGPVTTAPTSSSSPKTDRSRNISERRKFSIALPGDTWAIEIDNLGFDIEKYDFSSEGKSVYVVAENKQIGMIMSIFSEKSPIKGNSKDARKFYWDGAKTHPVPNSEVKKYERGQISFVEYVVKTAFGMPLNQKNIYAYLVKNDTWSYIHLSKVDFKPGEEKPFDSVLNSVKIRDTYIPDAYENSRFGYHYYTQKKYKEAIKYYSRAVEQFKKDSSPAKKIFHIVVEDLGIAYAYSGDNKKAMETFRYGTSVDPRYSRFIYDIACVYAESGDLDNAILYLRKAFQNKDNVLPGRPLPNPIQDPSFKNYYKNEKFVKAVNELYKN
ncbi:MAG: tetratricopeptide repeat protein [Nitrospirota bacterium]